MSMNIENFKIYGEVNFRTVYTLGYNMHKCEHMHLYM
jgi:hypothetical protein